MYYKENKNIIRLRRPKTDEARKEMSQHFAVGGSREQRYGPTWMFSPATESGSVDRRRLRYTVCEQKTKRKKKLYPTSPTAVVVDVPAKAARKHILSTAPLVTIRTLWRRRS